MSKATPTRTPAPTLKEHLHQIAQRLRKHWHGKTTLWEATIHCTALVTLPLCVCLLFGLTWGLFTSFETRAYEVVMNIGVGLTLLAIGWWCKGMFALSNRLLSDQRFFAGLLAFLIVCPVAWQLVTNLSVGFVESVANELEAHARKSKITDGWEHRPMNVLALPERHRFSVTGDIGAGSAKALAKALAAHPNIRLIELESPGGFVREADLLVELIERNEMDTLVRGRCASACTEIFLAGKRRFAGPDARFGFHQSGFDGRERNTEWSIAEYESSIFYRSKGISQDFADLALNTSYYRVWRPHVVDVKRAGFATQWWSDRPKEYD